MTDITLILQAILTVCAVLLTGMIILWLNSRTTEQERDNLLQWVRIAVQAAEQIYKSGNGTEKKRCRISPEQRFYRVGGRAGQRY